MMLAQTAASKPPWSPSLRAVQPDTLSLWQPGLWRFALPGGSRILVGVTDRSGGMEVLQAALPKRCGLVLAEQVHGTSVAAIESPTPPVNPIPGCDALITRLPGLALVIRTADCLPLIAWDPIQRVVGLAHAGWRGLATHLPIRLLSGMRSCYRSRPQDVWVGIGPAIRDCCYEVGHEFAPRFGPFVRETNGRWTCDLIGCAIHHLLAAGVSASHVVDCGQCTACQTARWHSVRRDAGTSGRLLSVVMIRP